MADLIRLAIIFVGIIIAVRLKVFVGYTLFAAGLLLAIMYQLPVSSIPTLYKDVLFSERFLSLYGIIILITFLGRLLKEIGYFERLVSASRQLVGGPRTAAAVLPALVGLMPMPGGALLSAPLVAEVLPKNKYSPEFLTVVNYWSRHVIEFCWPVYPGLILSAALTSQSVGRIALLQMPLTLIMIPIGIIFLVSKIKEKGDGSGHIIKPFIKIMSSVWPIILAIAVSAILDIELLWAVGISLILLFIIGRPRMAQLKAVGAEAFSPRLFILVFGIISFQSVLDITGAVSSIPKLTTVYGLPPAIIIFGLTFTTGLLTGMVNAFVGLSYPLLAGYLYKPDINLGNIFLTFLAGYLGMILSPTHFCLVLTAEYFKANLGKVYRIMILPLLVLFLAGLLLYIIGYPWNLFEGF
jgi:integral membrane protein (TIGR00529 family)